MYRSESDESRITAAKSCPSTMLGASEEMTKYAWSTQIAMWDSR